MECAANAREALRVLEQDRIDLILLDHMMPEMSGIDLLRLLRATQSASELPVIMVTAVSDSSKVVEALASGANDYVTKPIDFPVALARVEAQLIRQQAERELRHNAERLALASSGANEGIFDWNLQDGTLYVSERWKTITGLKDWAGQNAAHWLEVLAKGDRERFEQEVLRAASVSDQERLETEVRIPQEDDNCRWLQIKGCYQRDPQGKSLRLVGAVTDLSWAKAHDALTALGNRHMLNFWMEQADQDFDLILVGLDRYKMVEDSLGKSAVEAMVEETAVRLQRGLEKWRANGGKARLARLELEQFGIYLEPAVGPAEEWAQQLVRDIEEPIEVGPRSLFTSATIGIAQGRGLEVVRDAQIAFEQARMSGRGQVKRFQEEMRGKALTQMELENDLRLALERGQLHVYYQPKMDLSGGRVSGFEALLRWKHPERGMVPPDVFIPLAEETGLILSIGEYVLEQACRTMKHWRDKYPNRSDLEISVNVSAYQMREPGIVNRIHDVLQKTGLEADALQLEITESVFIADTRQMRQSFQELKQIGVRLNLDDFGTGYSSLQYLSSLRFDGLKIDKSFLRNINDDRQASDLVRSMMSIAKSLNMEVVAEGVETKQQLAHLKEMGCEYGQGYLFSKALPAEEAEQLLREGN